MKEVEKKVAAKKLVDLDLNSLAKEIVKQKEKDFLKEKERVFEELILTRVSYTGSWMLHGHSHNGCFFTERNYSKYKILDVGVDAIGFSPISYNEVKLKMVGRKNYPHHGRIL